MINAKFLAFGENFSSLWVNNWTGTLSFLGANKFNIAWQFYGGTEPFIELNHALSTIDKFDWVVLLGKDVLWNADQIKQLLLNDTYDAIAGWKYLNNGTTDAVQSLDERALLYNNAVNYLNPQDVTIRPLPFKVEYSHLSFVAFKANLVYNKRFIPQYIEDNNNKFLLPWHFSVCKQFKEQGNEIYLDPRLQMKTLIERIV
jgi:hypothetical protein